MKIRNISLRLKTCLFIIMICLTGAGCTSFSINANLKGEEIIYKKSVGFFIKGNNGLRQIYISKGKRPLSLYYAIQNQDMSLTAFIGSDRTLKRYNVPEKNRKVLTNSRYVLLLSGSEVIYYEDTYPFVSVLWLDKNHLQVTKPFLVKIIDEKGRVIKSKKSTTNQLDKVPPKSIH